MGNRIKTERLLEYVMSTYSSRWMNRVNREVT